MLFLCDSGRESFPNIHTVVCHACTLLLDPFWKKRKKVNKSRCLVAEFLIDFYLLTFLI